MRRAELIAIVLVAVTITACSSGDVATPIGPEASSVAIASTTTTTTTTTSTASTTTPATTTTPTTTPSTTTTTTTTTAAAPTTTAAPTSTTGTAAPVGAIVLDPLDAVSFPLETEVEIGRSVEGRPITVIRRGTAGGTVVLAVGVIHGNEADGVAIIDRLAAEPVPAGVELWLVRSMNPDGQAIGDRQNANLVDLNRNFPENWDVLGVPGDWQYAGPSPASEPETRAMVSLGAAIRPDLVLWYHQDLFRIAPGSGRPGEIRTRYAEIAGLPIVDISGGTYTGTASQWSRSVIRPEGVGITVELGPAVTDAEVAAHVSAVHTVATEYW